MSSGAERTQVSLLPDGRLHLHDGPIDLILEADGSPVAVKAAYQEATQRFTSVLDELCTELPALRLPSRSTSRIFRSPVARRMEQSVARYADHMFITPMAAVAGSVADEILSCVRKAVDQGLTRLSVNNGGDIALWLAEGEAMNIALVNRPDQPSIFARTRIRSDDLIGGIATSGAPGRSFSLGIADAVTVLARTAAEADAAATVIANAVDCPDDPRVHRAAARTLQPDSDLGDLLVTRHVEPLDKTSIAAALSKGVVVAEDLLHRDLIAGAALHLQGETRVAAPHGLVLPSEPGSRMEYSHA